MLFRFTCAHTLVGWFVKVACSSILLCLLTILTYIALITLHYSSILRFVSIGILTVVVMSDDKKFSEVLHNAGNVTCNNNV